MIEYKCQFIHLETALNDEEAQLIIPELKEWNFLDFTSEYIKIKLNFTNPLYISTFGEKDTLDIQFLNTSLFKASLDNYLLAQNYSILNINIPP